MGDYSLRSFYYTLSELSGITAPLVRVVSPKGPLRGILRIQLKTNDYKRLQLTIDNYTNY